MTNIRLYVTQVLEILKDYIYVIYNYCFYYDSTPYLINHHLLGIVQDMDEYAEELPSYLLGITQYDSDLVPFTEL